MKGVAWFDSIAVTCEHASNTVPRDLARYFGGKSKWVASHAGWDIGALGVAKIVSKALGARLFQGGVSRLVVDLNRSAHRPGVFSKVTAALDEEKRDALLAKYWMPYRDAVTKAFDRKAGGPGGQALLHLSIHSFTPVLRGTKRAADVGVLYDPKRRKEAAFARDLAEALRVANPKWRVRLNYPYVGYSDGFTTTLRKRYAGKRYAGVEIEWNQDQISTSAGQRRVAHALLQALATLALIALIFSAAPLSALAAPRAAHIATTCKDVPDALVEADPRRRQESLKALVDEFGSKTEPAALAAAVALRELAAADQKGPTYFAKMERTARLLNDFEWGRAKPPARPSLAADLFELSAAFPLPEARTSMRDRQTTECMTEGRDLIFEDFLKRLLPSVRSVAKAADLEALVVSIESFQFFPSGLAAGFGATTSWTPQVTPRICVNPEESALQSTIRVLHELHHASNRTIGRSIVDLEKAVSEFTGKSASADLLGRFRAVEVERFYDELRAYAVDVKAVRAIVASSPELFCRLWVPSFRAGRPTRFPSNFAALEQRFLAGEAPLWIADFYTFKMNSYRPSSLFIFPALEEELLPEVDAGAKRVVEGLGLK